MKTSGTPSFFIDADLPKVTLAMLGVFISGMTSLHHPNNVRWQLRGFIALSSDVDVAPEPGITESQILYICQSRECEALMAQHPHSPFLIMHDGDTAPDWVAFQSERVFMVKKDRPYSFFLLMVHEFFLNTTFWSRKMRDLVEGSGTFQDLVDSSQNIIENHIYLLDNSNSLIAATPGDPIDGVGKMITENTGLTSSLLEALDLSSPIDSNSFKMLKTKSKDGEELEAFIFPIWASGSFFGNALIVCDQINMTEGFRDFVLQFLDWVKKLCDRVWRVEIESSSPVNMFLVNLISGKEMSQETIDSQIKLLNFPKNPQFKLILLGTGTNMRSDRVGAMMEAATYLNSSFNIVFRYAGQLLALLYSEDTDDGSFALQTVTDDVNSHICEKFDTFAGTSQVFQNITDIDLAYRQAVLACEYKTAIDEEYAIADSKSTKTVYAFEDALIYYLIDDRDEDDRFREFTFSHSFLDKVIARDKKNGTNDFNLLWVYLNCDCNISSTAKQLFMHRNTVIYHIDKLRDTFKLDFSDKGTRDRCLIDFKIKFLSAGKPSSTPKQ